ncbi:MAG: hypothetical protein HQM00_10260, partial [Magnetococcales bacterium]|nr:hypothetical protein [Magnetococcales bacterium]
MRSLWNSPILRTALYLLAGIAIIETLGFLPKEHDSKRKSLEYQRHYTLKAHNPDRFDLILYGHSTAATDLDPETMAQELTEMRIFN